MADAPAIRAAVGRVLDEAVAEHARLRAVDEEAFVERARAAYQRVAMESAPQDGIDL